MLRSGNILDHESTIDRHNERFLPLRARFAGEAATVAAVTILFASLSRNSTDRTSGQIGMIEDRYRYATPRGIVALAGISESKAHAALILFKQRGRWIDLRDPAVRIYLKGNKPAALNRQRSAQSLNCAIRSALRM